MAIDKCFALMYIIFENSIEHLMKNTIFLFKIVKKSPVFVQNMQKQPEHIFFQHDSFSFRQNATSDIRENILFVWNTQTHNFIMSVFVKSLFLHIFTFCEIPSLPRKHKCDNVVLFDSQCKWHSKKRRTLQVRPSFSMSCVGRLLQKQHYNQCMFVK